MALVQKIRANLLSLTRMLGVFFGFAIGLLLMTYVLVRGVKLSH